LIGFHWDLDEKAGLWFFHCLCFCLTVWRYNR
jgi:hypothetical protein